MPPNALFFIFAKPKAKAIRICLFCALSMCARATHKVYLFNIFSAFWFSFLCRKCCCCIWISTFGTRQRAQTLYAWIFTHEEGKQFIWESNWKSNREEFFVENWNLSFLFFPSFCFDMHFCFYSELMFACLCVCSASACTFHFPIQSLCFIIRQFVLCIQF